MVRFDIHRTTFGSEQYGVVMCILHLQQSAHCRRVWQRNLVQGDGRRRHLPPWTPASQWHERSWCSSNLCAASSSLMAAADIVRNGRLLCNEVPEGIASVCPCAAEMRCVSCMTSSGPVALIISWCVTHKLMRRRLSLNKKHRSSSRLMGSTSAWLSAPAVSPHALHDDAGRGGALQVQHCQLVGFTILQPLLLLLHVRCISK